MRKARRMSGTSQEQSLNERLSFLPVMSEAALTLLTSTQATIEQLGPHSQKFLKSSSSRALTLIASTQSSNPEQLKASEKPNKYKEKPRSHMFAANEELDDAQEIVKQPKN